MEISIDLGDPLPVFAQLIEQVKQAVKAGSLRPGNVLPPIRQLASDLQINPNTVAKAYRLLERDSIIETLGRRGTVVHHNARENCKIDLAELAFKQLRDCVDSLRDSGITDTELRNAFNRVLNGSSQQ